MRWWDGLQWLPGSPSNQETDPHVWAMLSHFGLLFFYFVPLLVIRLTIGKDDEFVRHHSTEALNAMITFGIVWNVFIGTGWLLADATGHFGWFFLALGSVLGFVWILVTSILGAVKAYRGEWWRYPGALRLVRGATTTPPSPLQRH